MNKYLLVTQDGICERTQNPCRNCWRGRRYTSMRFTCPRFCPNDRGFEGDFRKIPGRIIRRQYFLIPIILFLPFLMIGLAILLGSTAAGKTQIQDLISGFGIVAFTAAIIATPLFLLSILNRYCFGRKCCVLNESGIWFNEKMLAWDNIHSMVFHFNLPNRTRWQCCYVEMNSGGQWFRIPHAPVYLLRKVRRLKSEIEITVNKTDRWILILVPTAAFVIMFFVSWLHP